MRAFFGGLLLAAGLLCSVIAWREWAGGTPPLWTLVATRVDTEVTGVALSEEVDASGHHRKVAHVSVTWPPGAASSQEVEGLRPKNDVWHMHTAVEYVRDHPVGSPLTVRDVHGRPMADRTDLRELGYALAASALALSFAVPGLALVAGRVRGHLPAPDA